MFKIIPNYLQGTAKKWHKFIYGPFTPDESKPKNYQELKTSMIKDLCPADYRSVLSQQLNNAFQKPGQTTISFIYEIQELCLRIDDGISEMFILSIIKEKLLPQIKYAISLQNPQNLQQLIESARLAERSMFSSNNT